MSPTVPKMASQSLCVSNVCIVEKLLAHLTLSALKKCGLQGLIHV